MLNNKIEKVQYRCIKVTDPYDLNVCNLLDLEIYLVDTNKSNFNDTYESLIQKRLGDF
jgi:hypothetical protein